MNAPRIGDVAPASPRAVVQNADKPAAKGRMIDIFA